MPVGTTKLEVPDVRRTMQVPSTVVLSIKLPVLMLVPTTEHVPLVTVVPEADAE